MINLNLSSPTHASVLLFHNPSALNLSGVVPKYELPTGHRYKQIAFLSKPDSKPEIDDNSFI
jgi:hypothetical protein